MLETLAGLEAGDAGARAAAERGRHLRAAPDARAAARRLERPRSPLLSASCGPSRRGRGWRRRCAGEPLKLLAGEPLERVAAAARGHACSACATARWRVACGEGTRASASSALQRPGRRALGAARVPARRAPRAGARVRLSDGSTERMGARARRPADRTRRAHAAAAAREDNVRAAAAWVLERTLAAARAGRALPATAPSRASTSATRRCCASSCSAPCAGCAGSTTCWRRRATARSPTSTPRCSRRCASAPISCSSSIACRPTPRSTRRWSRRSRRTHRGGASFVNAVLRRIARDPRLDGLAGATSATRCAGWRSRPATPTSSSRRWLDRFGAAAHAAPARRQQPAEADAAARLSRPRRPRAAGGAPDRRRAARWSRRRCRRWD